MIDFEEILRGFVREVEPTPAQKEDAQRTQNNLRDKLRTKILGERIVGCYLSGSYARHTAIFPLDDVDVIVLIDPTKWKIGFFSELPEPAAVLQTFEGAVRYRYPDSQVRMQRRSIGLKLYRMDLDIVPAVPESRESDRIRIPDTVSNSWIVSAPKVHADAATAVNKARDKQFIPLVKLLKRWNSQLPGKTQLKSFAIETLAVRVFRVVPFNGLAEGALLFFDFIAAFSGQAICRKWQDTFDISLGYWFTPSIPDIAGTGSNLVAGMDEDQRVRFIQRAIRARADLIKGLEASTPERAEDALARALCIGG